MKINIASPLTGTQKIFDIEDEKKLHLLTDKQISHTFEGEILGEQFRGYTFKITGGQDKQGFPMKQGVLTNTRVKLLLARGTVGYQKWRGRKGERRRKTIRGAIVGNDIAVLNCVVLKEGAEKIEGLNDHVIPRRYGPKRASKIRKLFNLTKKDDVRKYVIRRYLPAKVGKDGKKRKPRFKAPKIQRLITPVVLERRRRKKKLLQQRRNKHREERSEYFASLHHRNQLQRHRKRMAALRAVAAARRKELSKERRRLKLKAKKEKKASAKKLSGKAKQKAGKTAKVSKTKKGSKATKGSKTQKPAKTAKTAKPAPKAKKAGKA